MPEVADDPLVRVWAGGLASAELGVEAEAAGEAAADMGLASPRRWHASSKMNAPMRGSDHASSRRAPREVSRCSRFSASMLL